MYMSKARLQAHANGLSTFRDIPGERLVKTGHVGSRTQKRPLRGSVRSREDFLLIGRLRTGFAVIHIERGGERPERPFEYSQRIGNRETVVRYRHACLLAADDA